jgi:hypothetical protein
MCCLLLCILAIIIFTYTLKLLLVSGMVKGACPSEHHHFHQSLNYRVFFSSVAYVNVYVEQFVFFLTLSVLFNRREVDESERRPSFLFLFVARLVVRLTRYQVQMKEN